MTSPDHLTPLCVLFAERPVIIANHVDDKTAVNPTLVNLLNGYASRSMTLSPAVSGGWTAGAGQQPGRAQYQTLRDQPQELPICQHPAERLSQRGDLRSD